MPAYDLPPALKLAVEERVIGRAGLQSGVDALTRTYKTGGRSAEGMDFGAYLAARLPATYAAVTKAFEVAQTHLPEFAPVSVLDIGAGPGTASWAATEVWDSLAKVTFVDTNRLFLKLALDLAKSGSCAALQNASGLHDGMESVAATASLVVAAYALAELPEAKATTVVRHLWTISQEALIVVEPGTPAGFARIRAARTALITAGATIAAPCPHADDCPVLSPDWCHFSVRLARSRLHMQAKGASVPFEDERFSYLVATRGPATPAQARILSPTSISKPGVNLRLCTSGGIESRTVPKRAGAEFKRAKKADWGDAF